MSEYYRCPDCGHGDWVEPRPARGWIDGIFFTERWQYWTPLALPHPWMPRARRCDRDDGMPGVEIALPLLGSLVLFRLSGGDAR